MPFQSLEVGAYHTCGVRVDGAVDCWGSYYHIKGFGLERLEDPGILEPPERFYLARAGAAYPCGLNTTGTAVCWERDGDAADITPPRHFKAVSAGRYHTCGIEPAGTLACWGTHGSRGRDGSTIRVVRDGQRGTSPRLRVGTRRQGRLLELRLRSPVIVGSAGPRCSVQVGESRVDTSTTTVFAGSRFDDTVALLGPRG